MLNLQKIQLSNLNQINYFYDFYISCFAYITEFLKSRTKITLSYDLYFKNLLL